MLGGFGIHQLLVDVSKFKVIAKVGEGNFGEVKKALRPATKKTPEMTVAIKFLKSDNIRTSSALQAFHKEIECQAALHHPAVLPIIGYSIPFGGKGFYTVITEFMPKGSLFELIKDVNSGNGPDDWENKKAINIFGIAAGMAYIHKKNIIHRDLKTDNVMLDDKYYPNICDFGFSKYYEEGVTDQLSMTMKIGTKAYMAPELVFGEGYSNKVDVFAYAIVLYEIFTLNKPYFDATFDLKQLTAYVNNGTRPTIKDGEVPEPFLQLIHDCWDNDPDHRPAFIDIVKEFIDNKEAYFGDVVASDSEFNLYIDDCIEPLGLSQ